MITIIHGDDSFSSRSLVLDQKNRKIPNITLDGKNLDLTTISQIVDSDNLFSEKPVIFIENLFSDKKGKELEVIIDYLKKKQSVADISLWEGKEISKKYLEVFKSEKIYLFKHPSSIFTFLDAISPQNGASLVLLFHQLLKSSAPEQIIYMLIRQFRILLAIKNTEISESIDEIKKLSNWQKSKIEKQGKLFSEESLRKIYLKLFQLDYQHKTGMLQKPIVQAIDFLLLDI
ncbi:MAG: hypothetical protein HYT08_00635 [Candidatus Levybacteria bacterium]|nr:hypothetical protein [Candidatus Levybacteria bacterium]